MKISVISVTENGRKLSEKITTVLNGHEVKRFCFHRFTDEFSVPFLKVSELVSEIFSGYDALIFVCACGIAVRGIAPFVKSKTIDPAVIVIDDMGKYVISLLSGHIGGANALSEYIAEKIGALPIITTATDTGNKFSPDSFAKANNLIITDMNAAKEIASAVLQNEKIGFCCDYEYNGLPHELSEKMNCRTGIYIGEKSEFKPFDVTLQLIPKNISIGIGCKKNTPFEIVLSRVEETLSGCGILLERINFVGSVDLKSDETGLLDFCRKIEITPKFYSADELMSLKGEFTPSEFVKKITGVDNVCERSAMMNGKRLIIPKNSGNGVTVAVAETEVKIDFERRII